MLNTLLTNLWLRFEELKEQEDGQGLIEYAVIAVLVSVALFATLIALTGGIDTALDKVTTKLGGTP